ncbi:HlyD family secretion protein [Halopseudomonas aestusnigri]|uniref:Membrane fusion protein, multidrug efflux system n=1 Tax=Halopseudomonas aestusnigri TaxID=857252 RepID=A0AAQ1JP78_9GAMM|nr:HlyD family secretion protein [Halopseudomonas aestusnigri]OWL90241.1 transporter [Halopseudomonas aestusnigri]SEF88063.1 membrane fusion protein, multidrug efflux system [Halopseudomonas aestusnigri]
MSARVRARLFVFLLLCAVAGLVAVGHWWLVGRFYEETDNAYVQGDITLVSSRLSAQVTEVLVDDNQTVVPGDLLVRLDPRDFEIALAQATANLATRSAEKQQAQSRLRQQDSLIAAAEANVEASQAEQRRVELDIKRITPLRQSGYASEEQLSNYRAQLEVARAQVSKARAELQTQTLAKDTLAADIARLDAQIQAAEAAVGQARLDLERTEIRAPVAGRIGQRNVRIGQNVSPGSNLLAVVPDTELWIKANFKETQISRMHEGLRAELVFDTFPDQPVTGTLQSLFPASGAQFSLLPPDNATGNFTKVVQRIPVKLVVDEDNPLAGLIRPGMSVHVKVDLRD